MDPIYAALLSWAVTLTGYAAPVEAPRVVKVPHAVLERDACGDRRCKVVGWFPPGDTVFIDDRLDAEADLFAASIVVHEMVHYLQQNSHRYPRPYACEDSVRMEREAYAAQQAFLVRYGVYRPVGLSLHDVGCETQAATQ